MTRILSGQWTDMEPLKIRIRVQIQYPCFRCTSSASRQRCQICGLDHVSVCCLHPTIQKLSSMTPQVLWLFVSSFPDEKEQCCGGKQCISRPLFCCAVYPM